ncbi:hypothetical protein TPR58_20570 [Sphingomonas sp. HF-S3]|uniref:Uncharacterized protein n=1 Tax=Sphingomonas rustica TaxID=3103142 RepID=A0ABV0BDE9_9SPHN
MIQFHPGPAPARAGLGDQGDPGSAWLEWPDPSQSIDAIVPNAVRTSIAEALCRVGAVTFCLKRPHPSMVVTPVRQGLAGRLLRGPLRQGTTRDPQAVELLFHDPLQAWWLGSAVALVSDPDGPLPLLDAAAWRALTGRRWIEVARGHPSIDAALRAGVDGEMAGWWSRNPALRDRFAATLPNA